MKFADGDGFLDVFIYIILMVVGLAASAYRNYTKRKQAQQNKAPGDLYPEFPELETEPEYEEDVFEEEPAYSANTYDQSSTDAPEITETQQPVIPEPVAQTIGKESQLDRPVSEVEVQESLIDVIPEYNSELIPDNQANKSHKLQDDITRGDLAHDEIHDSIEEEIIIGSFDAKKAIIYSEIINRKYV
jgi:hypothetical protein